MRIILTITIIILITACQVNEPENITSVISQFITACIEEPTHNQNCLKIQLNADLNRQVGEVEIINKETVKVEFRYNGASTAPKNTTSLR